MTEITTGQAIVFTGDASTAKPAITVDGVDDDPTDYTRLGTSAPVNTTRDGTRMMFEQDTNEVLSGNTIAIVEVFRTLERIKVMLSLNDFDIDTLAQCLGRVEITPTAAASGTKGQKEIVFPRSGVVEEFSLVLRTTFSAYDGADLITQLWLPRVKAMGNVEVKIVNGEPVMVPFECTAVFDTTTGINTLGAYTQNTAVAT